MVETLIISVLGSFIYDHADFFTTANKQINQGYNWEWNYKDRNPNVLQYHSSMRMDQKRLSGF